MVEEVHKIIREEIKRVLFGHPIPNKGEEGYKSYWHDLETVSLRASHYHAVSDVYEDAIIDISTFLAMESISSEDKLKQISNVVKDCNKEIRVLNQEWKQDNRELRQSSSK